MNAPDKMALAVNKAMDNYRVAAMRAAAMNPHGMGLDAKRSRAWCEYGFPNDITFQMLYNLYSRGGIAYGGLNKLKNGCWITNPEVIEGDQDDENKTETTWEKKTKKTLNARFWRGFAEADLYRMVGRFSGLLLHIADNEDWKKPVKGTSRAITKVTPVWASSLKPMEIITDTADENYGQPKYWQYTENDTGTAKRVVEIHPDRIFIMGDWQEGAIGMLEPAYNAFVSLEKVEGGSGESFLKNASRQVSVSFDKDINFADIAAVYNVSVDDLQEKFNEAAREINRGNDQMLITQGAQVTSLSQAVSDPVPTYTVNLQTAGCALDIPSKILVGMQTGERASTEDQKYMNHRCQARRMDLSFDVEDVVNQLMKIKVIELKEEISVIWDDLSEQAPEDKLSSAEKMTNINDKAITAAMEPVFTRKEIRVAAGYEPDNLDGEVLPEDKKDDDVIVDPVKPEVEDAE